MCDGMSSIGSGALGGVPVRRFSGWFFRSRLLRPSRVFGGFARLCFSRPRRLRVHFFRLAPSDGRSFEKQLRLVAQFFARAIHRNLF